MSWRSNKGSTSEGGYTIMELFVSISIMIVITSIVVANRSKSNEGPALKNDADLISLAIRQAQVNSISVKESSLGSGDFSNGYGVSFAKNANTSYVTFVDSNGNSGNGVYDGPSELVSTGTLGNNNFITGICYVPFAGPEDCGHQKMDVTFLRPNTAASIAINGARGLPLKAGKVIIASPSGLTRSIYVYTTGQVSVQ
jgi:Tfp pilus assembly protein FimT